MSADWGLGQFAAACVSLLIMGGGLGWGAHKMLGTKSALTLSESQQRAVEAAANLGLQAIEHTKEFHALVESQSTRFYTEIMGTRGILTALASETEHLAELIRDGRALMQEYHEQNRYEFGRIAESQHAVERSLERMVSVVGSVRCTAPCCTPTRDR